MEHSLNARILGQRIRQLRTRRGMTQQDLAGTDYSKSYISAIEQGKTRPSLEALQRMASRLQVPAGTLLDPDAPGFTPFNPEDMHRRVRRRRGPRGGSGGEIFEPAQVDLQLAGAELSIHAGRPEEALQMLRPFMPRDEESPQTARPLRALDIAQLQQVYYLAAMATVRLGNSTDALDYLQKGSNLARQLNDRPGLERLRNILGEAYFQAGQPLSALEHHHACLDAVESGVLRDPSFKLRIYSNIAADYWALHDTERAIAAYRSALELLSDVTSLGRQANALWDLASDYTKAFSYATARRYADRAAGIYGALEGIRLAAQMEYRYGELLVEMEDLEAAETYLSRGLGAAEQLNSDIDRATVLTAQARLSMRKGNLQDAQAKTDQAVDTGRKALRETEASEQQEGKGSRKYAQLRADAARVLARALALDGELAAQNGDMGKADKLFKEAIKYIESQEVGDTASDIYQRYAKVLAGRGQHEQASQYFERAYRVATKR